VGVFGTSAGTEPGVDGYLRGQVFNREVPEVEDLHYRADDKLINRTNDDGDFEMYVTNSQIPATSDSLPMQVIPGFNRFNPFSPQNFYGLEILFRNGGVYHRLPEFLDSKKTISEVFSIYGYRYLVYALQLNIESYPTINQPTSPQPLENEDYNPFLTFNLAFYKKLKGNKFKLKRVISEVGGYSLAGWQILQYPPGHFYANRWYYSFQAQLAIELDVTTGLTRQIPRTP
jgi:hypothetical protein